MKGGRRVITGKGHGGIEEERANKRKSGAKMERGEEGGSNGGKKRGELEGGKDGWGKEGGKKVGRERRKSGGMN